MKKLLMSVGVLLCLNANAQWTNKNVNNDFDDPYRICYTESNDNNYLKLENLNGEIYFFMKGGYYCDENPTIDLALIKKWIKLSSWFFLGTLLYRSMFGFDRTIIWIDTFTILLQAVSITISTLITGE